MGKGGGGPSSFTGNLHPLHSQVSQSRTSVTQAYSHHYMATAELEHTCHFKHMTTAGPKTYACTYVTTAVWRLSQEITSFIPAQTK